MPEELVKVKITSWRGVEGRTSFAPGEWEVDSVTAGNLIAKGRATRVGGAKPVVKKPQADESTGKALENKPVENPRIPEKKEETETGDTPLPEDFPSREVLEAAGFGTVESLKAPDVQEKVAAVEGLTPADVTKIGLAISKI